MPFGTTLVMVPHHTESSCRCKVLCITPPTAERASRAFRASRTGGVGGGSALWGAISSLGMGAKGTKISAAACDLGVASLTSTTRYHEVDVQLAPAQCPPPDAGIATRPESSGTRFRSPRGTVTKNSS